MLGTMADDGSTVIVQGLPFAVEDEVSGTVAGVCWLCELTASRGCSNSKSILARSGPCVVRLSLRSVARVEEGIPRCVCSTSGEYVN